MDSFLIENIDEQAFYFGGGLYVHKMVTDENMRELQKLEDLSSNFSDMYISGSALNTFNLSRLQDEFNSRNSSTDSSILRGRLNAAKERKESYDPWVYDADSKESEMETFLEDVISSDIIILMNKSPVDGNQTFDEENYSIMVQKCQGEILMGFMVDKFAAYLIYNRGR